MDTTRALAELLRRPSNYFKLSGERQWEIDKCLGILDVDLQVADLTPEQRQRFNDHFGLTLKTHPPAI